MIVSRLIVVSLCFGLLTTSCATTEVVSSWYNEDYKGQIKNVYIIGLAENEINRMYFENSFYEKLRSGGVNAIPSSSDLPKDQVASRDIIIQKMKASGCDSVLLSKVVNQRTTGTYPSVQGSNRFVKGPYYSAQERVPYYTSWFAYYTFGPNPIPYNPPKITEIVVLSVESVLYDLETEEIIWSAYMETDLDANFEKMIQIFVDKVTQDLNDKGLI